MSTTDDYTGVDYPLEPQPVQPYYPPVSVDAVHRASMQDLAELGARTATHGLTTLQARALITRMQQLGVQTALAMAPELLDEIRKIQQARMVALTTQIRMLPNRLGWINRDRVLEIIERINASTPQP